MKKFLVGLVAGLAAVVASTSAFAYGQVMCSPDYSGALQGPRTIYNTTVVGSTLLGQSAQNPYITNSSGCVYMNAADVAYAQSQGWTTGSQTGVLNFTTGVLTGTTNVQIGFIPANAIITSVTFSNITANAAGNITMGNASGGAQCVTTTAVGATITLAVPQANIIPACAIATVGTTAPYTTPQQALWITSSAWNSANLLITVNFQYY